MEPQNQSLTGRCGENMPIDTEKEFGGSPAPESYVYMIYSAGLIKIGTSRDPIARATGLRNMSAHPVSLIWIGVGDTELERELHKRFAGSRERGEWFRPDPELREFIGERQGMGAMSPLERLAWAEANPDKNLGP